MHRQPASLPRSVASPPEYAEPAWEHYVAALDRFAHKVIVSQVVRHVYTAKTGRLRLLADIDLDGTSVSQNSGDTNAFYGAPHTFQQILTGEVASPHYAQAFVKTVADYSHVAER
jgi:lipid-binding SYLF domain-containing protein